MTNTLNSTSLFIDKKQAPSSENQGVIDIGRNCYKCHQLDFLPFHCEFCKHTYCSNHRTLESHQCSGQKQFENGHKPSASPHTGPTGPTANSLFPDREANKRTIDQRLAAQTPKPTTILEKSFRVGDVAKSTSNAFSKFNKFLKLQRTKKEKSTGTLGKLFTNKQSGAKNKVVEISLLRKQAKGDAKVVAGDRIYVWCLYIDAGEAASETHESEHFSRINQEKDRKAIWVSKNWPVGRGLDSIADQLHITNYNNSTNESSQRLNIFKVSPDNTPQLVAASARCNTAFQNGDTIYLVKGSI